MNRCAKDVVDNNRDDLIASGTSKMRDAHHTVWDMHIVIYGERIYTIT